jgi:decaprenylphospho-beta-D-erythro-pentofuranosid-2-ulose 2-reductase
MKKILIVGASSAIAQETAKIFAASKAWLFLTGRNREKLTAIGDDLRVRGADKVETYLLDMRDHHRHEEMLRSAIGAFDGLDAVLIAVGTLPNQRSCEQDVEQTVKEFTINCVSLMAFLLRVANYFEGQKRGCIAVITSVAGDRGRQSNYVYGAAKGAMDIFLQGIRNRLFKAGVAVVTIKPGFVDTPMTASLPKNFLFASPQAVSRGIYRAMLWRKDVVYVPWFWRWVMAIIRNIPEGAFKRMNL